MKDDGTFLSGFFGVVCAVGYVALLVAALWFFWTDPALPAAGRLLFSGFAIMFWAVLGWAAVNGGQ